MVSTLRANHARVEDGTKIEQLAAELSATNAEFQALWEGSDITVDFHSRTPRLHPGRLRQ
jgi:hypothetical protein